jgi:hypothetical protein
MIRPSSAAYPVSSTEAQMTDVLGDELVERLRQSLHAVLHWAEAYQPRVLGERDQYDADLDEAENVLAVVDGLFGPAAE